MNDIEEDIDIVVYCGGKLGSLHGDKTPPKPHPEIPITAYRLFLPPTETLPHGGWLELHYAMFNGIEFEATPSVDHMAADGPIPRAWSEVDIVASSAAHNEQVELHGGYDGGVLRAHYQWRCPDPKCAFYVDVNAEPMHQLFQLVGHTQDRKISLAQAHEATKSGGNKNRP